MIRTIKFFFQRLLRGWDDSDTWALDIVTSRFVLPRLKRYKEINIVDWSRHNKAEGVDVINELIWFHEIMAKDDLWTLTKESGVRFQKASELWGKYYTAIWW